MLVATMLAVGLLVVVTQAGADDPPPLGSLSERYESGGSGPGTVSTGLGDHGGVSYGTYQLSSKFGVADQFVKEFYPEEFAGMKSGTAVFTTRWKRLALTERETLRANEHAFIKRTHYDPLAKRIKDDLQLDVSTRSAALRDVVWSTGVQHGPNTKVFHKALEAFAPPAIARLHDEVIIDTVYQERGRKDGDGTLVYFRKCSATVQKNVAKRFVSERAEALKRLAAER